MWCISEYEYVVGEAKITKIFAIFLQASGFLDLLADTQIVFLLINVIHLSHTTYVILRFVSFLTQIFASQGSLDFPWFIVSIKSEIE